MTLLASAGGELVQADEDNARDVIHRFNETVLPAGAGLFRRGSAARRGPRALRLVGLPEGNSPHAAHA
jgi:hypothetical protein